MLGKKQVFEVKLALIIETYLSNKFNHKMAFKTSGGACIVLAEKNSEKKTEKNLVDDLAFKKLILESNNNEVSLSLLVFTAIQTSRGLTLIRASWWACQGLLGI